MLKKCTFWSERRVRRGDCSVVVVVVVVVAVAVVVVVVVVVVVAVIGATSPNIDKLCHLEEVGTGEFIVFQKVRSASLGLVEHWRTEQV